MKPYMLWLDLETTGLDPARDVILEVGAVIVDRELRKISDFQAVVYCDLGRASVNVHPDVVNMHSANGLWKAARGRDAVSVEHADELLARWASSFDWGGELIVPAGHNVHFDVSFIKALMPRTAKLLGHRHFDTSTLVRVNEMLDFPALEVPPSNHRALDDCYRDIESARRYLARLAGGHAS